MKNKILLLLIAAMIIATAPAVAANSAPGTPAIPSGPSSGLAGTSYGYYVSSTDPDGNSLKYVIAWGDGATSTSPLMTSGSSVKMFHKWTAGTYQVKAQAIDSLGAASAWSAPLTVTIGGTTPPPAVNRAPVTPSIPSGQASGNSGTSYGYSTAASDPDGNKVKYTFTWGDGTSSTTILVSSGTTASASHAWTVAAGTSKTFAVTATATDEAGLVSPISGARSVTISGPVVANRPPRTPNTPFGKMMGDIRYSYSYKTMATDPDGNQVKYTFDWGDGTEFTTGYVASGTYVSASHKWPNIGTSKSYSIRAMATDNLGAKSAWSDPIKVIMTVPYVNYPPTAPEFTGPTSGVSGKPYAFTVVSTDQNEGDTIKYLISWGDGTNTETALFPSGQPVIVSHTWNVPAGKTWRCYIIAVAIDRYLKQSADCSEPLIFTVTGPSLLSTAAPLIFADELEVDENEIVEEAIDVPANDSNSTEEDILPEEPDNDSENITEELI